MTPRVVLLDIDGTLITCGGAGRRAMQQALSAHVGRQDVLEFPFGGLTDRLITRRALEAAGVSANSATIDAVLETYLERLPAALEETVGYEVLSGVAGLVGKLAAEPAVALGLGTGNIEQGARHKLEYGDLWEVFAFGGFGSDHEVRDEILRVGAERGARHLGLDDMPAVFVVGDTPHDVSAARAIAASCVAVATGGFSEGDLLQAGAELVVDDLADARALEFLLG